MPQATIRQITVVREYGNHYSLEEFVSRIIRQHIKKEKSERLSKGCSNHEVNNFEK